MPLSKGKSKQAFSHNVKVEMEHGKPQKQALAIAYSMKRRQKKAKGGPISAKEESRPMPNQEHNDKHDAERTKRPHPRAEMAAEKTRPKREPIKHPRMVPSDAFSTRLYDAEGNLMGHMRPASPEEQPAKWMDEEEAKKQGFSPDMASEHSTHRKPYAKGGEIQPSDKKHPKNPFEDDHLEHLDPSEDEGTMYADEHDEMDQDGHGPTPQDEDDLMMAEGGTPEPEPSPSPNSKDPLKSVRDYVGKHTDGGPKEYARGGHVSPEDEEHIEHEDSIAAAIMAKKARERGHEAAMSDSDIDEMVMLYDGGEIMEQSDDILSHGSMDSDDSDQADLSRNHDEDANEEDQASWNALRRENYNSSDLDIDNPKDAAMKGDSKEKSEEDEHDMVSAIRSKMKSKRQFSQR